MRGSYLSGAHITLAIAIVAFSSTSLGQEARCNELGAACISAEALNGGLTWSGEYFNPTDSTSKEATFENGTAAGFARGRSVQMSSDATVLSRLPAGHSVRAFLAGTPGSGGTLWIGDDNLSAKARYAVRWYQYHSPDFNSLGAKLFAANNSGGPGAGQFSMPGGRIQLYGLNGHTYSGGSMGDCCISGPPVNVSGYQSNLSGLQGKWWRFEVVLENPAGPGIRYRLFAKNITDNLPEIAVIDTGVPCAGCRPDPAGLGASDLRPPALVNDLIINGYRESEDGSPLAGWRGYSHVLYAGWDTNAGQRIGGAQEVEGSGGGAPPLVAPNPPTSLSAQ